MEQGHPYPWNRQGRKGFERLLADLLRDLREIRRMSRALAGQVVGPGRVPVFEDYRAYALKEERVLEELVEGVRTDIETVGENSFVRPNLLADLRRRRRNRRRFLRDLPDELFAGLPVVSSEADARRIAAIERQALPASPDAESALLLLPSAWLRAIGRHCGVPSNASRARLAARSAWPLYQGVALGYLLERHVGPTHLWFLARIVEAGRLPEEALDLPDREGLRVDLDWRAPASGVGARFRQLGILFVGMEEGRPVVYVPENTRPFMAAALLDKLPTSSTPAEARWKQRLVTLSAPAVLRRAREEGYHRDGTVPVYGVPSRRARIRRRTPGPDRVADLELVVRGRVPAVRRRVRISYQRSLGVLYELILLTMRAYADYPPVFRAADDSTTFRAWSELTWRGNPTGARNQWTVSIRDALAETGGKLRYLHGFRREPDLQLDIRLVALHAPERAGAEPRVIWGEGVPSGSFGSEDLTCQGMIDAANFFLERLDM